MARTARGGAKRGATAGRAQAPAHNDADEAMEDARAEIDDTTAELDAGASAGESSGAPARALPPALLQRRLDKANSVAESAIKEKEAMQKKWMRCEPSWSWPSQMLVILCRLLIIPFLPPPARYAGSA